MAVALEELTTGVLEASVGPWAIAVGAGALAVALAGRSSRPLGRIAASGILAAERAGWPLAGRRRAGQTRPGGWLRAVTRGWLSLVDEARAEYEAGRRPPVAARLPVDGTSAGGGRPTAGRSGRRLAGPEVFGSPRVVRSGGKARDGRGRFVTSSTNGTSTNRASANGTGRV